MHLILLRNRLWKKASRTEVFSEKPKEISKAFLELERCYPLLKLRQPSCLLEGKRLIGPFVPKGECRKAGPT